ncbi:uracil-xanthine permease family protein [Natrinema halophilum]|uniref:uracil-xanthine permease family protein n=1 Tax=Natrinema halophilum TaxID=1699371 RepID=UPI001F38AB57|nr:nucleobase:cation symporter-2 family protein [Natrinema halophilum]UHQ96182.1 purine permease [Natrinema halophilum]
MSSSDGSIDLAYELEDKPPIPEALLLGLQHVSAMFVPTIAVAIIVAGAVGVSSGDTTYLIQMVLVFSGLATLVQVFPFGPVGAKLPIVMGTSFAFVGAAIAIGSQYGLDAVFGAVVIGALVEILIGWQYDRIKTLFPPLVTGLIVMILGLYLIPVGMDYMAGGVGASDYGSYTNLGLALLVLGVTVGMNLFMDGIWRLLSILIGIVVGYIAAVALGVVDFSTVADAGWFALPIPGRFGFQFEPVAILTITAIHITAAIESIGDMSGITAAEGRNPDNDEISGGLFVDGLGSSIGAIFGAFPLTTFSQNVGIINFTGVMSRYVVGISGAVLLVLGFIPKVSAVVATIPSAVLGGAVIVMFGMVMASGLRLIFLNERMNRRNMVIIAVSIGLGLGVEVRAEIFEAMPTGVRIFFGNAIIMTAICAVLLNTLVPRPDGEYEMGLEEPVDGDDPSPAEPTAMNED